MNKKRLRDICDSSDRIKDIDYKSYKKEIGAIEIHDMEDYFLYMIDNNIKINNNTSNSIVAYLCHITDEKPNKPLKYKGGTMPDIDVDVSGKLRDNVIKYIVDKYGHEKVSMIGTYGKMFAKTSIRLVGKALGYDLEKVDEIARMVPPPDQGRNWTVEEAMNISEDLAKVYKNDKVAHNILRWANRLSGTLSHRSVHAAGVIISNENISNIAPTWQKDDMSILEYDGSEAEKVGFVKIDLLALKTLDIIHDTIELINKNYNTNISMYDIPLEDDKVFDFIKRGKLLGVFQIEGSGISTFAKRLNPVAFSDISLILAGYRPGPMKFTENILAVKQGKIPEIKPHSERFPILKDILEETYGYFIYQEQIIEVAKKIAHYDDIEANNFLNIIRKKKQHLLPIEKEKFVPKAIEAGLSQSQAEELWTEMEDFGSYSFNKSHSVAYSILTMQTAWLKTYYTSEFIATNISYELASIDKVIDLIAESKSLGIKLLPPDINLSSGKFSVLGKDKILYGLAGIIGLGESKAKEIIEERDKNGDFKSLTDFIIRVKPRSTVIENLIKSGAFDSFGYRSQFLSIYKDMLDTIRRYTSKEYYIDDILSRDREVLDLPVMLEYSIEKLMDLEKEVSNIYLTSTPYDLYKEEIAEYRSKYNNARFGTLSSFKVFKKKNGMFLFIGNDRYLVFEKVFKKINKRYKIKQLVGELIILHANPFKEDGLYVVNDLFVFKDKIQNTIEKYTIDIPLTQKGIKKSIKYKNKLNIVKFNTNKILYLNLKGKNIKFKKIIGYINE